MAVESKIIFSIGSKAIGGFTELRSAIDLLGQAYNLVKNTTKELDQFSQMWQKTNQAAVMAADAAAGGLVDTGKVLQGYQKLMAGGVKVTDEQFKILTARAADLAQATGGDATEAFEELTEAIRTGSVDALKKYGIKLKESESLTESQTDAIKALTEGHENLSVSAQTATEKFYVLENNIGTMKGLLWDMFDASEAVAGGMDTLNGALGEFNTILAESPSAAEKYIFSLKGIKAAIVELNLQFIKSASSVIIAAAPSLLQGGLEKARDWIIGKLEGAASGLLQDDLEGLYKATGPGTKPSDFEWQGPLPPEEKKRGGRGGGGGGGGRRRSGGGGRGGGEEMTFTEADVDAFQKQELDDFFGPGNVSNLSNEELEYKIELENTLLSTREEELELEREKAEFKDEEREKELDYAKEFNQAWSSSMSNIDIGSQRMSKAFKIFGIAAGGAIDAAQKSQKETGKAVASTLIEIGGAISQEASWQALMEGARMIAAIAERKYFAAAAHGAAMGMYIAVAAKAGGGGSGKGAGVASEANSRTAGMRHIEDDASAFGGGGSGGRSDGSTTISIQLKEGAGGFFDAIVEENDRASIDGRPAFSRGSEGATGIGNY